nr:hypothetical protein [Entomoplasma ellychniae]
MSRFNDLPKLSLSYVNDIIKIIKKLKGVEMNFDKNNLNYQEWITQTDLDPELKILLNNASDVELNAAFNFQLEFGTAGIRGISGPGPGRFNSYTIKKLL